VGIKEQIHFLGRRRLRAAAICCFVGIYASNCGNGLSKSGEM
jgi:hypothetical protein